MKIAKQLLITIVFVHSLAYMNSAHAMNDLLALESEALVSEGKALAREGKEIVSARATEGKAVASVSKVLTAADRALFSAIEKADIDKVSDALKNIENVNITDDKGYTPLARAIVKKNTPIIELLITNKADIHLVDKWGKAALATAAAMGHAPSVKLLLTMNADSNSCDQDGITPLMHASQHERSNGNTDYPSTVKMLLTHGAQVDAVHEKNGYTALMYAAKSGCPLVAKLLIDSKAPVNALCSDIHTPTPLMLATTSTNPSSAHVARILILNKADVNAANNSGLTALMWAVKMNHDPVAYLLLTNKAHIDAVDKEGYTALAYAALYNRTSLVTTLLAHGAHIEALTNQGRTPLMTALNFDNIITAEALLDCKADVNAVDTKDGYTPLMLAIITHPNSTATAQLLLQRKAHVDAPDKKKKTALRHALERNAAHETLEMLITAGADGDSVAVDGLTPMQAAQPEVQEVMKAAQAKRVMQQQGQKDIEHMLQKETVFACVQARDNQQVQEQQKEINMRLLKAAINGLEQEACIALDNGAQVDVVDLIGRTPLMWAIFYGHASIVRMLLDKKACILVMDDYGCTPFSIAYDKRNDNHNKIEIVRILRAEYMATKKANRRKELQLRSLEKQIIKAGELMQEDVDGQGFLLAALQDCKAALLAH